MKSPKVATPVVAPAIPIPQMDSAELVDVARRRRTQTQEQEGTAASLLTEGGARGDFGVAPSRKKKLGSVAYS